ncbi:MAG: glycosyltransferase family 2 protein [Thermodesulfobacteriota bacterium]
MTRENIEISVVVPVYNSSATLRELNRRLIHTLIELVADRYEILYINDGSRDDSWRILGELTMENGNLTAVNLTRNFGQHNAIMCGFSEAAGNYIITIDDDLQLPPEEIAALYREIQNGHDIVYGLYRQKKHSVFRNLGSEFVQFVYMRTFDTDIRLTSFRIIRREIISKILSYEKSFTFIDGLISWYTSNIGKVYVEHHERKIGKSGYSLKRLIVLSLNMLTNFSIVPVQIASLIGILFSLTGFLAGFLFFCKKLFFDVPVSGFTALIVTVTIFSGVQLLTLGILGEYISRIHINVNNRPQYAVREIAALHRKPEAR